MMKVFAEGGMRGTRSTGPASTIRPEVSKFVRNKRRAQVLGAFSQIPGKGKGGAVAKIRG